MYIIGLESVGQSHFYYESLSVASGDLQRTFGVNVRAVHHSRGMSQEQFTDLVGVHRTYMGSVERGERNLSLKSVESLCEQLVWSQSPTQ